MQISYVEYACFGQYEADSASCLYGCVDSTVEACLIATLHIPTAPARELTEYLVSTNLSIKSRAIARLEELQCGQ